MSAQPSSPICFAAQQKPASHALYFFIGLIALGAAHAEDFPTARTAVRIEQIAPSSSGLITPAAPAVAPARPSTPTVVYQAAVVTAEREGNGHRIVATNASAVPVSVMALLKNAENVQTESTWPAFAVVPPNGTVILGRTRAAVAGTKYAFQLPSRSIFGDYTAQPEQDFPYRLPFQDGKTFRISQAAGGVMVTHNQPGSAFAVDFPMPVGTPLVAVRDGIVVKAEGSNTEGGQSQDMLRKANAIRIQHADGSIASYGHLAPNGVLVNPGQRVTAGTTIGFSGNTGYSSSPHLHFAISQAARTADALDTVSIPFKFYVGNPATVFVPQQWMVVKAEYTKPMGMPPILVVQRKE